MKKVLVLFLVLTMAVSCLPVVAFAEMGGNQTITTDVPEETLVTPEVIVTMPEPGEHPTTTGTPTDENASMYTVTGVSFSQNGTSLSATDTFGQGTYTVTISVKINEDAHAAFSSSAATAVSSTDGTVTYSAPQASVDSNSKVATYTFEYAIGEPSWTLRIPASTEVTYGDNKTTIQFTGMDQEDDPLEITDLKYVPRSMVIEASFQHTGSFVNKTDSTATIPFTVTDRIGEEQGGEQQPYAANTPHKVHSKEWQNLPSIPYEGWINGRTATQVSINVTSLAWAAAKPGTYETTFVYSSSARNKG